MRVELADIVLNIAFGYNAKSRKKYSFLETLEANELINGDLSFQMSKEKQSIREKPSMVSIHLKALYKETTKSSAELCDEIHSQFEIPKELYNSLFTKVRLAKTITSKEVKEKSVIASLMAYSFFGKQFITSF